MVFPELTPQFWDLQVAVSGVGAWEYANFMTHHINAMTEYLISKGHGDPSNGADAITPNSFKMHFKRHATGPAVDYWILI
eukprot:16176884-Heterocapsa_arctica.AAC.1